MVFWLRSAWLISPLKIGLWNPFSKWPIFHSCENGHDPFHHGAGTSWDDHPPSKVTRGLLGLEEEGDFLGSKGIVFFWIIQNHTWIFQVCKIYAFSPKKNLPKGRHLTYLEDAGMEDYTLENSYFEPQKKELDGR